MIMKIQDHQIENEKLKSILFSQKNKRLFIFTLKIIENK